MSHRDRRFSHLSANADVGVATATLKLSGAIWISGNKPFVFDYDSNISLPLGVIRFSGQSGLLILSQVAFQ